ncbi:MAG TPA: ABC transporter ATP-binding protein [Acidimicrobiales bacterium]|nr:ABC transporter ATP-binding protein [Acidimicrobiales bacterium]
MASRLRFRRRATAEVPVGEVRRAITRFGPALAGQRLRITGAVALALASTALELLKPWPISWVIDHLVAAPDPATISLPPLLGFAAIALLVPVALGFATERLEILVATISRKATVRIRSQLFGHMNRLELAEHQRHYTGDLLVRLMGDVNMIRDLLVPSWLNLLSRGSLLIGAAAVFAIIDWRLFLVALVPLPLLWIRLERTSTAVKSAAGKQRRKEGAIASRAAESLRQVGLIKAFAAEERTTDLFVREARSAERATMAAARHAARMTRTTEVLTGLGVALVLVVGAVRVRDGMLTPGELVLVISYTRMLYKPVRKLTAEGARLAKAVACANRVIDLLDRPVEQADDGRRVPPLRGRIEIRGLGHVYSDGRRSLAGLDAQVPAGSLVAVTGENGTGKSTLLSLLLRLHAPSDGAILVDGIDIADLRLSAYREQIAYVPQELSLFSGTIRDNIVFARPGATDDDVRAAAEMALFTPVLDHLPLGLDTELDEAGASLSGGQARRLMLTRAALRDASILLLDEPLAGLDPDARTLVARAISNIANGRTTFVVHHGDLADLAPDMELRLEQVRADRPPLRAVGT